MRMIDRFSLAPSFAVTRVWPVALGIAALAGTVASGCAMPFVGLATLAAVTLPRRHAFVAMALMWLANQVVGFTFLGFPRDAATFGWGLVLGMASLLALIVARRLTVGRDQNPVRLLGALAAGFVCYQAGIFAFANILGLPCPFTPSVIAQVALNDALWFAGLYAFHIVLREAVPGWFLPRVRPGHA